MIARFWSAKSTQALAPAYAAHLESYVFPTLRKLSGYIRAALLQREVGETVEIIVITYWQSFDSIRAFSGPDLETAVVADEAAALLTSYDRRVRHYDVVAKDPEFLTRTSARPLDRYGWRGRRGCSRQ